MSTAARFANFGLSDREGNELIQAMRVLPQRARDFIRSELGAGRGGGDIAIIEAACDCLPGDIGLRPILTGTPGWGQAEIPDAFVPGPFIFPFATNATTATEVILSGQGGDWSTANAATTGDANLSAFMPPDADWLLVINGYDFQVAEDGDVDNAAGFSLLQLGSNWQHNKQGIQPYTFHALGHMTRVTEVNVRTFADVAAGAAAVYATERSYELGRPIIPRGVDMRNDLLVINTPASTNIAPGVTLRLFGFGIVPSKMKNGNNDQMRTKLAWLVKGARSLPAPIVQRALAMMGNRG
jgi:hypothetical protein